jgi:hypothetical protein
MPPTDAASLSMDESLLFSPAAESWLPNLRSIRMCHRLHRDVRAVIPFMEMSFPASPSNSLRGIGLIQNLG